MAGQYTCTLQLTTCNIIYILGTPQYHGSVNTGIIIIIIVIGGGATFIILLLPHCRHFILGILFYIISSSVKPPLSAFIYLGYFSENQNKVTAISIFTFASNWLCACALLIELQIISSVHYFNFAYHTSNILYYCNAEHERPIYNNKINYNIISRRYYNMYICIYALE